MKNLKNTYVIYTPLSNITKGKKVGEVYFIKYTKVNKLLI